jgi:hypothetical protein
MPAGKKYGGRVKGTPNKKTQGVIDKLAELKCDPIEGMAKIAEQAMSEGDLPLAGNMYKELAQYVAPKRKAMEISGDKDAPLAITQVERTIVDTQTKGS